MSPPVHRLGDANSGGGVIESIAQGTVYANEKLVSINGSAVSDNSVFFADASGFSGAGGTAGGKGGTRTANGSATVFIGGIPVNRQGDADTDRRSRAAGSPNVFVGDTVVLPPPAPPRSALFVKPPTRVAADQSPYKRTAPPPTRAENIQAGTAPNNPGVADTPPIQDQPVTECEPGKPNVLGFLAKCLSEASTGAWRETGQGGRPSNPNIINMWKDIGITQYTSDQTPWCAGFACFAMKQSGLKYIREPGARAVADKLGSGSVDPKYKTVSISELKAGDLVLWGSGHVSFCYTASNGRYTFVGGNQMPGKAATPPVRDPNNDGDVTISYPGGWIPSLGGITKVVRLDC